MKNQVIEVLDREHGKKVIEYWESKGVDASDVALIRNKKAGSIFRYYGIIDGRFDCYSERQSAENNAEIIELPKEEKPFPRVMLVSDDGDFWYKRVVLMQKCDRFLAWDNAETIENAEFTYSVSAWRYAKELQEKVELTKSEIAEKFGISIEQLVIKDD